MRAPPCSAREQELPRTGRATGAGGRRGHGRTAGCPAHRVPRERPAQLAVRAVVAQHEAKYLHLMQRRPPCSSSVSRRALARAEGGRQRPAQPHAGGLHAAADTAALSLCERMRTGVLAACHTQGSENSLARLSDRTSRGPARATPGAAQAQRPQHQHPNIHYVCLGVLGVRQGAVVRPSTKFINVRNSSPRLGTEQTHTHAVAQGVPCKPGAVAGCNRPAVPGVQRRKDSPACRELIPLPSACRVLRERDLCLQLVRALAFSY